MAFFNKLAEGVVEEAQFWGDVGKGAFGMAFDLAKGVGKPAWSAAKTVGPPAGKALNFMGKRAAEGASWEISSMLRHPHAAIIEGAALYGIWQLHKTGPQARDTTPAQDAELAAEYDMPSTGFNLGEGSTRAALIGSTEGLTLGLHRGRHHG